MARWGRCDYREFVNLRNKIKQIVDVDLDDFNENMVKELAARTLTKVVKRTPVISRRLRNSWQVGNVGKFNNFYVIEVFNSAEYAPYVEYGHMQIPGRYVPAINRKLKKSWVEGRFMLTISENEMKQNAQGIIERELTKFLAEKIR